MSVNRSRLDVAREVGKLLSTPEGREFFAANGYTSGESIVCAGYDEPVGEAIARARNHEPPVTLATIDSTGELRMMTMRPSKGAAGVGTPHQKVSVNSTVGMLFEAALLSEKSTRFQITKWDIPAEATPMPSTKMLLHA